MGTLPPAFDPKGTITAANASSLNDGACTLLLGNEKFKEKAGYKIVAYASHAQDPLWFTTAPVTAMENALKKAQLSWNDMDAFEINEAFAVVVLSAIKDCTLDKSKVNMWGGAISLGHPIGCSGTRIILTLMSILKHHQKRRGMATLCIGGGEALAMIIERL